MGWYGGPVGLLLIQLVMPRSFAFKAHLRYTDQSFQELYLQFPVKMQFKLDIIVVFKRQRCHFVDLYMQIHSQYNSVRN